MNVHSGRVMAQEEWQYVMMPPFHGIGTAGDAVNCHDEVDICFWGYDVTVWAAFIGGGPKKWGHSHNFVNLNRLNKFHWKSLVNM